MTTPNAPVNVLLIGGGGREHALALGLSASPKLGTLYATDTANPGIAKLAKPVDVPVSIGEIYRLRQFCDAKQIGLVVIGPEDPLAEGFADELKADGRLVFGPGKAGAQLEADKAFCKELCREASIPTAEGRVFTEYQAALEYLESREHPPVIKAAGLAKGKGVFVPSSMDEARAALDELMLARGFGKAGDRVLLEERLSGPEVSVLALYDGRNLMLLPPCQDHKRIGEDDTGPNTGGMGAYCPAPVLDEALMDRVEREILIPTVDALRRDKIDYVGVLYAGLMLTHSGPKLLEYNCRFGDPECQPLLSRYRGDLLELLIATCTKKLHEVETDWDERPAVSVVLASAGYPASSSKGDVIEGADEADSVEDVTVHHAGTAMRDGSLVTNGGRVLAVTALGDSIADARDRAYEAADKISFRGMQIRRDIGAKAIGASAQASSASD